MEPPAYSPPEPARPHRSILDLRTQIIANGSIIRPRNEVHKASDDHVELIVAKTPDPNRHRSRNPRLHWSEKEALAACNTGSDPMRSVHEGSNVNAPPVLTRRAGGGDPVGSARGPSVVGAAATGGVAVGLEVRSIMQCL